jgi:hypothetical protein
MKSVDDIKNITGLSRQRINILIQKGDIKAKLFGKKMYIIEDKEVEKFLKNRADNPDTRLKKLNGKYFK